MLFRREQTDPKQDISKIVLGIYDDFSQDGLEINGLLIAKIDEEKKLVPKLAEVILICSKLFTTLTSISIKTCGIPSQAVSTQTFGYVVNIKLIEECAQQTLIYMVV